MMFAWQPEAKFFEGLFQVDEREMRRAQQGGCAECGGRLDRADFPRKPRGIPAAWESIFSRRFSLCCSAEGCRKRLTPASVRFLGRRVYAAVAVLMASVSTWVAACVPRRTLGRWAAWWCGPFVASAFFRAARARLMPPLDESQLPASLLERFALGTRGDIEPALLGALVFVSPITTRSPSFSRDGP